MYTYIHIYVYIYIKIYQPANKYSFFGLDFEGWHGFEPHLELRWIDIHLETSNVPPKKTHGMPTFWEISETFFWGGDSFWGNEVWQLLLYGCYDVSVRWTPVSVAQNHLFVGGYGGLRRAINCWTISSGNLAVCYGKSPCLIGKSRKIDNFHPCYPC